MRKYNPPTISPINPPTYPESVHVCALADHEDGEAYEIACHYVPLTDVFVTALQALATCADHVCIVSDEDYNTHRHIYTELAPYAINISKGIYA